MLQKMLQVIRYYSRRVEFINKIMSPSSLLLLFYPRGRGHCGEWTTRFRPLDISPRMGGRVGETWDSRPGYFPRASATHSWPCSGPSGLCNHITRLLFLWLLVELGQWEALAGDSTLTNLFSTPYCHLPSCLTALSAVISFVCGSGSYVEAPLPGLLLSASPCLTLQAQS